MEDSDKKRRVARRRTDRREEPGDKRVNANDEEQERREEEDRDSSTKLHAVSALNDACCARWCLVLRDGSCQIDEAKIKCLLSREERKDTLLMRNVVHGTIASGQVHPLVFQEASDEDDEMVRLRSLSFFERLLSAKNGEEKEKDKEKEEEDRGDGDSREVDNNKVYAGLTEEQKRIVAVGVRDLYLAASHGLLDDREKHLLDGMLDLVDEAVGCIEATGMNISFHPSANFKVLKFIESLDEAVGTEWAPYFAQVMEKPKLFAVFVDPVELSFHNFENIVPLDRWIESQRQQLDNDELALDDACQLREGREVFTCKLRGDACDLLKRLSTLDLYVPPLNKATRGGERFIFHSALLSKALTSAFKSSTLLRILAQGRLAKTFSFVNYVFRCNRFAPGNAKFASHLDTPYYDAARSQVSKYTLIIYLTTGCNNPALRVNDVEMNKIEEMTCVIFNQKYEHEGKAYLDSDKVFIRSELVFEDDGLAHNRKIASLFSEACYMIGQSVFDEELATYAHECFERANSLHWSVEREATQPPAYLHKQFDGRHFVTNGYDYWFKKSNVANVVDCGMLAVLDYFNCKLDGKPFRSLCRSTTVRKRFKSAKEVWSRLRTGRKKVVALKRLDETVVDDLVEEEEEDSNDASFCCGSQDRWKHRVQNIYEVCCGYTRRQLFRAPLLFLNQEIVINESNVKVVNDKLFFLQTAGAKPLPPINFAACWHEYGSPRWDVNVAAEISAPRLLIPPVLFHECEEGYHLVLDFFRNDWMVRADIERKIPIPTTAKGPTSFLSKVPGAREHPEGFSGYEWDQIYDSEEEEDEDEDEEDEEDEDEENEDGDENGNEVEAAS